MVVVLLGLILCWIESLGACHTHSGACQAETLDVWLHNDCKNCNSFWTICKYSISMLFRPVFALVLC